MRPSFFWLLVGLWVFFLLAACVVGTGEDHCESNRDCPLSQFCLGGQCQKRAGEKKTEPLPPDGQDGSSQDLPPDKVRPEPPPGEGSESLPEEENEGREETTEQPPTCIDQDNDGHCQNLPGPTGQTDCDDENRRVYPGAPEECNGQDDDCNGLIDDNLGEGPPCSQREGVCAGARRICAGKKGWLDCSEDDYKKYSNGLFEKEETSCDGQDNDCDGQTDETFAEKGQPCQDTRQKGICRQGVYTACKGGKLVCTSRVSPQKEICDGQDNDCDGRLDESFPERGQNCKVSGQKGACQNGKLNRCTQGKLVCVQTISAVKEVCGDGQDNDCDGSVDETPPCICRPGQRQSCYTGPSGTAGKGICQKGRQSCTSDARWGPCTGEVKPGTEVCDGKDNDCDGQTDNKPNSTTPLKRSCYTGPSGTSGKGLCQEGSQSCTSGQWGPCTGEVKPGTEVCDGKDNDCDGRLDESFPEKGKSCTVPNEQGVCAQGTFSTCTNGKIVCSSTVTARPEICFNNKDDDCNGKTDEAPPCNYIPIKQNIADYTVMSDGSVFVLYITSRNKLYGVCYAKDGKTKQAAFSIATSSYRIESPTVVSSPSPSASIGSYHLVSWVDRRMISSSSRSIRSRLYGADCKPLSVPMIWPRGEGSYSLYGTALDATGSFVLLYRDPKNSNRPTLAFYDRRGTSLGIYAVTQQNLCNSPGYGMHVALNASGSGVVTCQRHYRDPIYYRRFKGPRNFLDAELVKVADSDNNSSYQQTHIVGINNKGDFALQWQNYQKGQNEVALYNAAGQKITHFVLSSAVGSGRDGFQAVHQRVELLGDDFIFRDTNTPSSQKTVWYRYDATGKLISAAKSDLRQDSLRLHGNHNYLIDGSDLRWGELDFSPGKGLCQGQVCLCTPQEKQPCYSGGTTTSPRSPCKAGIRTCATDGLSWGSCSGEVLPTPEACNNNKDDDCDGDIDENCNLTNTVDLPGVSDYDVANDGSIVAIHWTGTALLGHCFGPNRTLLKGSFVIVPFGHKVDTPSVKIASTSKLFLVAWRELSASSSGKGTFYWRLYNSSCSPLTAAQAWPNKETSRRIVDTAIDNKGNFALLWKDDSARTPYLSFYSNTGSQQGSNLKVDPSERYCNGGGYGMHVSFNPATGAGLVTCQKYYRDPIYFRLFGANHTLAGTSMTLVQGTSPYSARNEGHINGMNSKGEFVIAWQDYRYRTFKAAFYDTTGKQTKILTLRTNLRNYYDGYRYVHQSAELWGDDFILRDADRYLSPPAWYHCNSLGVLLGKSSGSQTSYRLDSLRIGNKKAYIIDKNNLIRIGTITFP